MGRWITPTTPVRRAEPQNVNHSCHFDNYDLHIDECGKTVSMDEHPGNGWTE